MPLPQVASLSALNDHMAEADAADETRRIARRSQTVGEAGAVEASHLLALPEEPYDVTTTLSCIVDTKARICVRQCYYSVPAGLARRRVEVRLGGRHLGVFDKGKLVATHERGLHRGSEELVLDHYLEILVRKPGALPGSTALVAARASGAFGPIHEAFWREARRRLGDAAGTRALIGVLLHQRVLPAGAVVAGMAAALGIGSVDPEVVAVEARRHLEAGAPAPVIPIGVALAARPTPTLEGYDALLEKAAR